MKQGSFIVVLATTALMACLAAAPVANAQVYKWTDENGITHYSDVPPPEGQDASVEDLPAETEAAGLGMAVEPDPTDSSGTAGELSAADLERRQIAEQREQRRAEQEVVNRLCAEARSRLEQIEPSRRVFYTDEDGETVRMDDEERVGEVEELRRYLNSNCT